MPGRMSRFASPLLGDEAAAGRAIATGRNHLLPRDKRSPNLASQMRVAFSSIASNTGPRSPGELEMTFNTSEVAVCCSRPRDLVRAQLVEQARVLDRDDGLGGKVLDQCDLLVR